MSARLTALPLLACLCLAAAPPAAPPAGPDPEPPARDRRVEAVWEIEKQFGNGWPSPGGLRMEFTPGKYYTLGDRGGRGGPRDYRLSPRKQPAQIDVDFGGGVGVRKGIYKVEDGKLYLTWAEEKGGKRPTSFDGKGSCVRVLKRVKE